MKEDWDYILSGKYSKIKKETKTTILGFFERYSGNYIYIYSYLHPEKWFERYAEILVVEKDLLEKVGELCNIPDMDKENLTIKIGDLEKI
jgi:hypothetical protein